MNIVVTGGRGFIGTALVGALAGHQVTVVDLPQDVRDPTVVRDSVVAGVDAVVHLAARTSVLGSMADPAQTFQVNVDATELLLERSLEVGVRRFVFASTNAVVGSGVPAGALINETSPCRPLTAYGASKRTAELLVSGYRRGYGLATSIVRMTNVYGVGMLAAGKDSIIPRLLRAARTGGGIDVYGDGRQVRDYVYVADVVRVLCALLADVDVELVTVGAGTSVSVLDLVAIAREVTDAPLPVRHVPAKPGEMPAVQVDIARLRDLGLAPDVRLRDGVAMTWAE